MNLHTYRKEVAKVSREKLAKQLETTPTTVYRWETGRSIPVTAMIRKIEQVTGGKVTATDFIHG